MDIQDLKRRLLWNPRALWQLVQQCFRLMNRFKKHVILANLYMLFIAIIGHFSMIPIVKMITPIRRWQDILTTLFAMPLSALAGTGLIVYYFHLVRKQESRPSLLFKVWNRTYIHTLFFMVAYYILYVFLIKYIIYIEYEGLRDNTTPKVQLLLGVFLFVFFLSRFLFSPAYIVDHYLSAKSGIKYSLLLTSTRGTKTFIVILAFFLIFVAGAFPSGVILLTWLLYDLSAFYLLLLFLSLPIFAYTMGPGLIAYIRMYDLYQQDMPILKDLTPPPHPVFLQSEETQETQKLLKKKKRKSSKKKKAKAASKKK